MKSHAVAAALCCLAFFEGCAETDPAASAPAKSNSTIPSNASSESEATEVPREVVVIVSDAISENTSLRVVNSRVAKHAQPHADFWHFEGTFTGEDADWRRSSHSFEADVLRERGDWKLASALIDNRPVAGDIHLVRREAQRVKAKVSRSATARDIQEAQQSAEAPRTWKTADGAFSTDATFISSGFGSVKLRKPDGAEISVPTEKLSDADQQWLRQRARQAP